MVAGMSQRLVSALSEFEVAGNRVRGQVAPENTINECASYTQLTLR